MKRLNTGIIVLDYIDIICLSFSLGSGIAFVFKEYKKYKERKVEDPIVLELKEKSPLIMFSENGKPLKLPLVRGGQNLMLLSLVIKNEKLAHLVRGGL